MKLISIRFSGLVVLLLLCNFGWGNVLDSLRTEKKGDQWIVIHQVDPGETLYSIARRYNTDIEKVIEINSIENNQIQSGQLLEIPIVKETTPKEITPKEEKVEIKKGQIHVVQEGETLFAIGRKYGVSADQIMSWNNLSSPALSIGQKLSINEKNLVTTSKRDNEPEIPFSRAKKHFVQSGENLEQIATRRNVSQDSLKKWNNLRSNDIKIGQILWYRTYDRQKEPVISREIFGKHIVEGIAMQIEDMEDTDKYLALHKELPTGTLLEIRNLMNNKKVYVRVVGQLPSTGINKDILIRLTPISFKRLGILDARSRVELTYYDE